MKIRKIIKVLFVTIVILLLLGTIAVSGYLCYKTYLRREEYSKELLLTEQEKTQIAYDANLARALKEKEKYDFIVVLNPAHGGTDGGKESTYGQEKDIVLAICEQVAEANADSEVGIFLTRDADVVMDENMRLAFMNELQPDVFIDVHVDKAADAGTYGTTVYYDTSYYNRKLTNAEFADIMEQSVVTAIEGFACGIFEVQNEEMQIIKGMQIPALSIACGDLSNEKEGYLLTTKPYQANVAKGILQAIAEAKKRIK